MERFLYELKRTHYCADLRLSDDGKTVILFGWVANLRDHGSCIFVNLRDRSGIVQLKFDRSINENIFNLAGELKPEYVIGILGYVADRKENRNPKIPTGEIEVIVQKLEIFNKSQTPPFVIQDDVDAGENLRLTYRYLDLRRPAIMKNIILRSRINKITHNYFDSQKFIEIETPILLKSTPEGARDYLVPSRVYKGRFYALPQSPQMLKQLCMVSGFDRYYQICRCFRDEDLRVDRQPEFTQIDIEMSFITEEDIFNVISGFIEDLFSKILGIKVERPFKIIPYDVAMAKYGSDKPDLRFGLEFIELNDVFKKSSFKVFTDTIAGGGIIKGIKIEGGSSFSRKDLDSFEKIVQDAGAKGLLVFKFNNNELSGSVVKYLNDDEKQMLINTASLINGDILLVIAGSLQIVHESLGILRLHLADKLSLRKKDDYKFAWITEFPLFEINKEDGKISSMHHPFTSPFYEDLMILEENPLKVRARAYDIVLNGIELGGGSIRIHDQSLQRRIFKILGLTEDESQEKFGFLLKAFEFGAPPHGGIALGMDRLVMILASADSLREVIAFPKTRKAQCLLTGSPSNVAVEQLGELGISVSESVSVESRE